jgi:tetratricopeptide (TPR) repeat protein
MFSFGSTDVNDSSTAFIKSPELLMSTGFTAKEQRQYDQALQAFLYALEARPSESMVPYLLIEIGSILKIKGKYDEAIALFSNGQKLPALIRNKPLQREFINIIAYLRIIKNVLLANRLSLMPFSEIPAEVMSQIDIEYADWNKLEEAI